MKKTMLRKLVVSVFAVAILCPLAKAQTMGGNDLEVADFIEKIPVQNKMVVADNGWIFLMVHNGRDTKQGNVKFYRSKDGGATYERLQNWFPRDGYRYQDIDIVVTGKNESDIKIWSIVLMNKNSDQYVSRVQVFEHNANFKIGGKVYQEDFSTLRLYNVAIATNYRAPSPRGKGGIPFALAFAYTGYNNTPKHSFVDYVFSLDGGKTFTKNLLFVQNGENKIGKVALSLGSTSESMGYSTFPLMGVVFEMNKARGLESDIGFLSNLVDNDPAYRWSAPIKVSKTNNALSPKIQMMLDEDNNTINGKKCHNFMITYTNRLLGAKNWDIRYVYPKTSFRYEEGKTPTMDDLMDDFVAISLRDETNSGLGYDKNGNNYLITYVLNENSGGTSKNKLIYRWANYNKIYDKNSWSPAYVYSSSTNSILTPQVDINPTKGRVCWSWVESTPNKQTVWTDTEWERPTGLEDITAANGAALKLAPNPAKDHTVISLETEGKYKATIHDTQGRILAAFAFSGKKYELSLQDFAKGVYLIRILTPTGENYSSKLVIE